MIGAEFIAGVAMLAFAASGVFFLKFWKASRNRFYALFSTSCFLLAAERITLILRKGFDQPIRSEITEANSWVYLIRLAAFLILILAIWDQNRKKEK